MPYSRGYELNDYYQYFWPQYTMIFPKQVQVGEPFNVVLDYTFVIPSIEYVNKGFN